MPEGPELLYFSTMLRKKFKNNTITDILSFTDKPVIIPKDFIGDIIDIDSKGKILWFQVTSKDKDYYIHIHYGLSGWFQFVKPEKNIKFEFIFKKKDKEIHLYLEDQRRFSKIKIYHKKEHEEKLNSLGYDIFSESFSLNNFKEVIKSKNTILASLLMNQQIFSGIGNYIKNEAMYLAKLKIKIKTSELNDEQIDKLYNNILFVAYSNLYEMLKDSDIGDKNILKSKRTNEPSKLHIPYIYKIYGREKTEDGKKVFKIKVGGRDSYCTKDLC